MRAKTKHEPPGELPANAALGPGELPPATIERLQAMAARQGTPAHCFTSSLSVGELVLAEQAGFAPLGQVMGCAAFQNNAPDDSAVSGELKLLTRVHNDALHAALDRLRQEARLLRADGVVGVVIRRRQVPFDGGGGTAELLEVVTTGTAVRRVGPPNSRRGDAPFLSLLSGQDLWTLRQAGFAPVGLAVGNCAYYRVGAWTLTQQASWLGSVSQERTDFTEAVYGARRLAMERMEQEARQAGAEGIVGVRVETTIRRSLPSGSSGDLFCHLLALGTAVAPAPRRDSMRAPIPMCLPLR